MRTLARIAALAVCGAAWMPAGAAAEKAAADAAKRPKLTPEQRTERRYRRYGGDVTKPVTGNYVAVVNPSAIDEASVEAGIASVRELLAFPFRQVRSAAEADARAVLRLEVVDEEGGDALTIYPERPGAKINVRALRADAPAVDVLRTRFVKEMWRAFAYSLGAGNSASMFQSVMKPAVSLRDLDRIRTVNAAPDGFNQMLEMARKIKLERQEVYTYREACIQGWAPQPTNEVQKAIWDEVHQIPDQPIRVKFGAKTKGK